MNPNTIFHFAALTYVQKMQSFVEDDEPEQLEWPLRLAAALLRVLWNLPTRLTNRSQVKQSASAPTLEHAAN